MTNWQERPEAKRIIPEIRAKAAGIPGIKVQVREQKSGPSSGKPIQIEVSGREVGRIADAVNVVRDTLDGVGGFVDVEDSRP